MSRPRNFFNLIPLERSLVIRAAFFLSGIKLALLLFPSALIKERLQNRPVIQTRRPGPSARQIIWSVEAAARFIPGAKSCLPQALAAEFLLRSRGIPAELKIGVARGEAGRFQAHAWVESGGDVLIGKSETLEYAVLSAQGAAE